MDSFDPGALIQGRYRVDERLGVGSFGVVWGATDAATGRAVALKVLRADRADEAARHRFLREVRIARALLHDRIVRVDDVIALADGREAIVMERLRGESLAARLARAGRLPLGDACTLAVRVAGALSAAHGAGIVHRDLSPRNLFLVEGEDDCDVRVLDFGLAKLTATTGEAAATRAITRTGEAVGTPHYMAPEQVLGDAEVDARADVWALGVVLHEVLAGEVPTRRPTFGEVLHAIVTGQIRPLDEAAPDVPAEVAALVRRMLSVARDERPSLAEVRARLAPFARPEEAPRGAGAPGSVRLRDRFEILDEVASGGMGTVFRARDRVTGEPAAVKIIRAPGREASLRLVEEATILARLDHPGIVRYVAHGPADDGDLYVAMEWLAGEDLGARLARGPLGIAEAVALGRAVADALGAAHARGVVHRDLKPSNLFLAGGDVERTKVLDFGIARRRGVPRAITRPSVTVGTPGYMAPEQISGEGTIDARTDVFALGCVLYEAVTGRPAFAGDSALALLAKALVDDPPLAGRLRPEAAGPLEALIARMLSKDPASRPANGQAVADALAALPAATTEAEPPPCFSRPEALTDEERRLMSVILLGEPGDLETRATAVDLPAGSGGGAEDDVTERVRSAVAPFLGHAAVLPDGSIVVTLLGLGTATDQAVHAARAALAVRAVAGSLCVALATGHDDAQARDASAGEAIDRAAKLVPLGTAGEVVVDRLTAALLHGRFEIQEQQGRPRVLGAERESLDGPRTLLGKVVPCVGRERELATLTGVLEECLEERVARAVLITGVPGAGKSRLRHELTLRARERAPGARVLFCQGDPITASAPFGLLGPALRRAMGVAHGEPVAASQQKVRAAVSQVAPEERERVAAVLGELMGVPFPETSHPWLLAARSSAIVHSDQVMRAWEDFVAADSASTPWLILVEDLHWGDAPSVRLIDAALRTSDAAICVLALARPEVDAVFPDLWAGRGVTRLSLAGLSKRASARLVREVLGGRVPDAEVERIVEQAGGNALYLEELVRAAEGPGEDELSTIDDQSPLSGRGRRLHAPVTVTALVQSRIEALAPAERRVLRAGSVLGLSFWLEAVDTLLGGTEPLPRLDATLRALVDLEVLVRATRSRLAGKREYTFRHALFREAAYAMLTDEDRALGHRLAAELLEAAGETEAAVIAEHHLRGGATRRAATWYRRAAEQALEANDLAGALERASRAIACGAEGEELGALRLRQAEAYEWLGDPARAEAHAWDAALLLPEGSAQWATAVAHAATASQRLGRTEHAVELAGHLARHVARPDPPRALLLAAARVAGNLVFAGHRALCADILRGVRAARGACEDPLLTARELSAEAQLRLAEGRPDRFVEVFQAAGAAFVDAGDHRSACSARGNAAFGLIAMGAHAEAEALLTALLADAERLRLAGIVAMAKHNLGLVRALLGSPAEGYRLEREAAETYAAQGDRRMEPAARMYAALILEQSGNLPGACAEADAAVGAAEPGSEEHLYARAVRAWLSVREGRPAEALARAREVREERAGRGPLHEGEVMIHLAWAEALFASGDIESARAAISEARDLVMQQASRILDEGRRATFLSGVPDNARVLSLAREWLSPGPRAGAG